MLVLFTREELKSELETRIADCLMQAHHLESLKVSGLPDSSAAEFRAQAQAFRNLLAWIEKPR
jgi:hypothetical protein